MNHYQILSFFSYFLFPFLFLYLFYPYVYHDKCLFLLHNYQTKLIHKYYHLFFYEKNLMKHLLMRLLRFCFSKKKISFFRLLI
jgi:hypothetical protein